MIIYENVFLDQEENFENFLKKQGLMLLVKKIKNFISFVSGSIITLANNDIKDIMKVIRSLRNRGILLKDMATLIFSNEYLNHIMKVVSRKTLKDAGLLIKSVSKTVEKEIKNKMEDF